MQNNLFSKPVPPPSPLIFLSQREDWPIYPEPSRSVIALHLQNWLAWRDIDAKVVSFEMRGYHEGLWWFATIIEARSGAQNWLYIRLPDEDVLGR